MNKTGRTLIEIVVTALLGYLLIALVDWRLACGLFLLVWSRNVANDLRRASMTTLYMVYYGQGDERRPATKHPVPEGRAREIIDVCKGKKPGVYTTEPPLPALPDSAEQRLKHVLTILSECRLFLASTTFDSVPAQLKANRVLGLIDGALPRD